MSNRRVLVLLNDYHLPPENLSQFDRDEVSWITEYDVISHLKAHGHDILTVPVNADLGPIKDSIESFKPHVIFNLLLEFQSETVFDQNVLAYLELLGIPYTGCNPRGYMLARDKVLAKKLFQYHNIKTPNFCVFPKNHPIIVPETLRYPLIVKCTTEDASLGMTQGSLVHSLAKLEERVAYLHETYHCDVIGEEFIEGRELYMGVLGNQKLTVLPTWELVFDKSPTPQKEFYHTYAKWNNAYRERKGIRSQKAELSANAEKRLADISKAIYRTLNLNGYARFDFRMTAEGEIYVLEANPNPDLSITEDFAVSANAAGISYPELLNRIISLGISWHQRL